MFNGPIYEVNHEIEMLAIARQNKTMFIFQSESFKCNIF